MGLNRDICIFTGAGFSKAIYEQAIQNEIIDDMLKSNAVNFLSNEIKTTLKKMNDIELVMSHYHNLAYTNLKNSDSYKVYKRKLLFVRTALVIYFMESFKNINSYQKKYKKLIAEYLNKRNISKDNLFIVTTNYDLGFEKIIDDIYGENAYYYPDINEIPQQRSSDKIPIFKLHGSINWLENRGRFDDSFFSRKSSFINTEILENVSINSLPTSNELMLEYNGAKYTPILIPFFFQKDSWLEGEHGKLWGTIFNNTWKRAREYLSEAKTIYFFGYGLPPADHHIFSFLYTILANNDANCILVNKSKDTVLNRMLKLIYETRPNDLYIPNEGDIIKYFRSTVGYRRCWVF